MKKTTRDRLEAGARRCRRLTPQTARSEDEIEMTDVLTEWEDKKDRISPTLGSDSESLAETGDRMAAEIKRLREDHSKLMRIDDVVLFYRDNPENVDGSKFREVLTALTAVITSVTHGWPGGVPFQADVRKLKAL